MKKLKWRPTLCDLLFVAPAAGAVALYAGEPVAAGLSAALPGVAAALNYVVDPFQRYRRRADGASGLRRLHYRIPGMLRAAEEYDTLLLGSSLIKCMTEQMVEAFVGGRCLKLVVPSPSARELGLVLRAASRSGRFRRIILALDPFACRGSSSRVGRKCPVALYRPDRIADLRYLFSRTVLRASFRLAGRRLFGRLSEAPRQEEPEEAATACDTVLREYAAGVPDRVRVRSECAAERLEENADRHLLAAFRAFPDVEFWVYLPPYSVLAWADNARKGVLEDALLFRRFLCRAVRSLRNVSLFDFQAETSVVSDLDEYYDVLHYSRAVNEWILKRMASGECRVSEEGLADAELLLREYANTAPERLETARASPIRPSGDTPARWSDVESPGRECLSELRPMCGVSCPTNGKEA